MSLTITHPLGDLEPALELQVLQSAARGDVGATRHADGTWTKPVNLTTATKVQVRVEPLDVDDRVPVLVRDAIVFDPEAGKVRLVWQSGDPVFTLGLYRVWTPIVWPGNRPQTVPGTPDSAVTLHVFSQRQR